MISILGVVASCDTTGNIEPPDDHFFVKYFGNDGNQEGVDMVQLADGTFVLFGNTDSPDMQQQIYLVGVDAQGNLLWEKTYGGAYDEFAKDIELTSDGRLVIVADSETSPGGNHDILIMTLGIDGNEMASALTGFTSGGVDTDETAVSVSETSDGFVVAGSTSNLELKPEGAGAGSDKRDALHLRYFDDLTDYPNTWRRAHGPGDDDVCVKIVQVTPDAFYFFGYSNTQKGDDNFYILGLGKDGETNQADNFLPGKAGSNEILTSVILSPIQSGEGFLLTGISSGNNSNDIYVVKLRKTLGFADTDIQYDVNLQAGLGAVLDLRTAAYASASSGFYIASNTMVDGVQNLYLTKIDNGGGVTWETPITFGGEMDDRVGSVVEMQDGSIGIIGTIATGQDGEKKMAFIKVNQNGKFLE